MKQPLTIFERKAVVIFWITTAFFTLGVRLFGR
jgi:hypothetical protein